MTLTGRQATALLGFALVIIGSFMPWARVLFVSVSGIEGDGAITVIAGIVGVLVILAARSRTAVFVALACGLISAGVALYDIRNVSSEDPVLGLKPEVGTGLYVVALGAVLATVFSLLRVGELRPAAEPPFQYKMPTE